MELAGNEWSETYRDAGPGKLRHLVGELSDGRDRAGYVVVVSIDRVAAGEVVDMTDPVRDHLDGHDEKGRSIHDVLASLTGLLSESDVHLEATQRGCRFTEAGAQGEDGAFEGPALVLCDLVSSCRSNVSIQSSQVIVSGSLGMVDSPANWKLLKYRVGPTSLSFHRSL
jgi:hypothetical protein